MSIALPRSATPRVSIIIPAFSSAEMFRACLRSLERCAPRHIPFETIMVLSEASQDVETEMRETVTGLQLVVSAVNLGFAGASNRGRSVARGALLMLLHDDTEVEPEWLEALVDAADAHPEAGAVGSKVLFPDGRLQNAGMILWRNATTSPPWLGEPPDPGTFDRLRKVDYCGTSSLLVRAGAWDAIGGLDERFYPAYFVDVDLAMALRSIGLVVLYQPASSVRHHRGTSTSLRFRTFVAARNQLLFLEKWGAALEQHELLDGDRATAIERAVERAERFAAPHPHHAAPIQPATRAVFDPVLQERRLLEKSRAIQRAYITHIADALAEAEGERDRTQARSAAQERDLVELRARHSALSAHITRLTEVLQEIEALRARWPEA